DYKEMDFFKPTGKSYGTYWTGKYYRSYWLDNNTSELCVPIGDDKWTHNSELYSQHFKSGKCIVKEEIAESEVSRWEVYNSYWTNRKTLIPILSFKKDELVYIKDRTDHKKIGQIIDYWWKNGWFIGYFLTGWSVNFEPQGVHCIYDPYKSQEIEKQFLFQTLKPKVQEKK
ncbi:MAG: hypothetical protein RQ763_05720, partial [Sulfurimonas sp.]|uniref:hypothetical protein n=1 Tax=Sulfurimonas sp. TaxID=2022749 RepID=UPI0028CDF62A